MATRGATAPARPISARITAPIAAAAAIVVVLGAIGLASIGGVAVPGQGAVNRAEQAWIERLQGLAVRQGEIAIARQRAVNADSARLTAQADALAARRLAHERATAAYSGRLTGLAEHLSVQAR